MVIIENERGRKKERRAGLLDPERKQALQALRYKTGQILQKDDYSTEDLEDILACLTNLIDIPPFTSKFLKWLGQFCRMPEVQEGARQKGGQKAVWGLNLFARIVRGL